MADEEKPPIVIRAASCPDDSVIPYKANIATPTNFEALRFHYQQELKAIERSFQSLIESLECQTIEIPMPDDEDIDTEEDCFTICCFTKDPNTGGLVAVVPKEGQVLAWSEDLQCYLPKDECCDDGFLNICGATVVPGEPGECDVWTPSQTQLTAVLVHETEQTQYRTDSTNLMQAGNAITANSNGQVWVHELENQVNSRHTYQFHRSKDSGQTWTIMDYTPPQAVGPTNRAYVPIDQEWALSERLHLGEPYNQSFDGNAWDAYEGGLDPVYYLPPASTKTLGGWVWVDGILYAAIVSFFDTSTTPLTSYITRLDLDDGAMDVKYSGYTFNSQYNNTGLPRVAQGNWEDYGERPQHRCLNIGHDGSDFFWGGWTPGIPNTSISYSTSVFRGGLGATINNNDQIDYYNPTILNKGTANERTLFWVRRSNGQYQHLQLEPNFDYGAQYTTSATWNGSQWVQEGAPDYQSEKLFYVSDYINVPQNLYKWTVVRRNSGDYIIHTDGNTGQTRKAYKFDDITVSAVEWDYTNETMAPNGTKSWELVYVEDKGIFLLSEMDSSNGNLYIKASGTGEPGTFSDPVEVLTPIKPLVDVDGSGHNIVWSGDKFLYHMHGEGDKRYTMTFDDVWECTAGEDGSDVIYENEPRDGDILVYDGESECWKFEQPLFGATDLINDQIVALDSTWSSSKINEKNNEILSFIRDSVVIASYGGIRLAAETAMADLGAGWETVPFDTQTLSSPIRVQQNPTTNSIVLASTGAWTININMTLEHDESNAGREMLIRLYNLTDDVALSNGTTVFVARNQPGSNISATILADVTDAVGKDIVVQVSGGTDSFTLVNVVDAAFFVTNNSPVAGLI